MVTHFSFLTNTYSMLCMCMWICMDYGNESITENWPYLILIHVHILLYHVPFPFLQVRGCVGLGACRSNSHVTRNLPVASHKVRGKWRAWHTTLHSRIPWKLRLTHVTQGLRDVGERNYEKLETDVSFSFRVEISSQQVRRLVVVWVWSVNIRIIRRKL
jgi:hypothetical protein